MGARITPVNGQPVHRGGLFMMQATSAETNVASVAAYLGLSVKAVSYTHLTLPTKRIV